MARVLLGNAVIQTELTSLPRDATLAPCRSCFHTHGSNDKMLPPEEVFDSVIYDNGTRRKYVIYNKDQAYREFLVKLFVC